MSTSQSPLPFYPTWQRDLGGMIRVIDVGMRDYPGSLGEHTNHASLKAEIFFQLAVRATQQRKKDQRDVWGLDLPFLALKMKKEGHEVAEWLLEAEYGLKFIANNKKWGPQSYKLKELNPINISKEQKKYSPLEHTERNKVLSAPWL